MDNTNTVEQVKTKPQAKTSPTPTIYVTTTRVNCRKGAGVEKPVLTVVENQTKVTATGETQKDSDGVEWIGVKFEKYKGFICNKYLKKE